MRRDVRVGVESGFNEKRCESWCRVVLMRRDVRVGVVWF